MKKTTYFPFPVLSNMTENNNIKYSEIPIILNGKFFKILNIASTDAKGHRTVTAKCVNCVNCTLSCFLSAISNLSRHLKVKVKVC